MSLRQSSSQRGFTLVELLLYLAVASLVVSSTIFMLLTFLESRVKQKTIAEVEGQGALVIDQISQVIRNAESITTPSANATGSSATLDVVTGAADPTTFDLSDGIIRIKEGAGSEVALTASPVTASDLTFANLTMSGTPGSLAVSFTLSMSNPAGRNEYSYTKTFQTAVSVR